MTAGIGGLIIGGLLASGVGTGAAEGITAGSIAIAGVNISGTVGPWHCSRPDRLNVALAGAPNGPS